MKDLKCEVCGWATTSSRGFNLHKKKSHLTCEECPFITASNFFMRRHARQHEYLSTTEAEEQGGNSIDF